MALPLGSMHYSVMRPRPDQRRSVSDRLSSLLPYSFLRVAPAEPCLIQPYPWDAPRTFCGFFWPLANAWPLTDHLRVRRQTGVGLTIGRTAIYSFLCGSDTGDLHLLLMLKVSWGLPVLLATTPSCVDSASLRSPDAVSSSAIFPVCRFRCAPTAPQQTNTSYVCACNSFASSCHSPASEITSRKYFSRSSSLSFLLF